MSMGDDAGIRPKIRFGGCRHELLNGWQFPERTWRPIILRIEPMSLFDSHYRPISLSNRLRVVAGLAILGMASQLSFPLIGVAQISPRTHALSTSARLDQAKKLVQGGDPQGALSLLKRAD